MTFVLFAVAAVYAVSITFVAALLGSSLWSGRREARERTLIAPVAPIGPDTELAEDGHRTSVA